MKVLGAVKSVWNKRLVKRESKLGMVEFIDIFTNIFQINFKN